MNTINFSINSVNLSIICITLVLVIGMVLGIQNSKNTHNKISEEILHGIDPMTASCAHNLAGMNDCLITSSKK
jgi:hypothetical protein